MWFAYTLAALAIVQLNATPLGPLSTDKAPFTATEHPLKPSDLWGPDIHAPYPTNTWWIDAILPPGTNTITPEPYSVQLRPAGVVAALPKKILGPEAIYLAKFFTFGLHMGFQGTSLGHQVIAYDAMSVTTQYSVKGKDKKGSVTYPLVKGSPYLTGVYEDTMPNITFATAQYQVLIIAVNGQSTPGAVEGNSFTIQLNTSQTWIVYTDRKAEFSWTPTYFKANKAEGTGKWTVRAVAIPWLKTVPQVRKILDNHALCIPVGGTFNSDVNGTTMEAMNIITWKAHKAGKDKSSCAPLLVAPPHMQDQLGQKKWLSLVYDGLTGNQVAVVEKEWTWRQGLANVTWFSPTPIPEKKREVILKQLKNDIKDVGFAPEPYSFGKQVCRFARLSLIAEELGDHESMNKSDEIIKKAFASWMDDEGSESVVYDSTWGGSVPASGLDNPGAAFGAGWYNDHHYHYGYWLYAAAVLAKHDKEWATQTAPRFTALARDIGNPSQEDPYFPAFRYFDWYSGHSWASGLMPFDSGRNQESTSEAINAWYGMVLYGEAIGNENMTNAGRLLLAAELRGAWKYWRSSSTHTVYPAPFAAKKGVGMVWGTKAEVQTWFGAGMVYALAISIMPYTPITEWYLTKEWVSETYPLLKKMIESGPYADDWKIIVHLMNAVTEPEDVWKQVMGMSVRSDEGMTKSNALWWAASRPNPKTLSPRGLPDFSGDSGNVLITGGDKTQAEEDIPQMPEPSTPAKGGKNPDKTTAKPPKPNQIHSSHGFVHSLGVLHHLFKELLIVCVVITVAALVGLGVMIRKGIVRVPQEEGQGLLEFSNPPTQYSTSYSTNA